MYYKYATTLIKTNFRLFKQPYLSSYNQSPAVFYSSNTRLTKNMFDFIYIYILFFV